MRGAALPGRPSTGAVVYAALPWSVHVTPVQCLSSTVAVRHPLRQVSHHLSRHNASISAFMSHDHVLAPVQMYLILLGQPGHYMRKRCATFVQPAFAWRAVDLRLSYARSVRVRPSCRPYSGVLRARLLRSVPPRIRIQCRCRNIVEDVERTIGLCSRQCFQTCVRRTELNRETKIETMLAS